MTPEEIARQIFDRQLEEFGWVVQNHGEMCKRRGKTGTVNGAL